MRREGLPAFIRSTICPEANSNVKCEMKMFGTAATRSKSELSLTGGVPLPFFFPVVSADHHILGSAFGGQPVLCASNKFIGCRCAASSKAE